MRRRERSSGPSALTRGACHGMYTESVAREAPPALPPQSPRQRRARCAHHLGPHIHYHQRPSSGRARLDTPGLPPGRQSGRCRRDKQPASNSASSHPDCSVGSARATTRRCTQSMATSRPPAPDTAARPSGACAAPERDRQTPCAAPVAQGQVTGFVWWHRDLSPRRCKPKSPTLRRTRAACTSLHTEVAQDGRNHRRTRL
jgi:hypothetical protein